MASKLTLQTKTDAATYLSQPSNSTFFQIKYAKPQRFAMEQTSQPFQDPPEFGGSATVVIKPVGDVLCGCQLEVTLTKLGNKYPDSQGLFYPVEALCKRMRLQVGGTTLDDFDSDYLRQFDTWHRNDQDKQAYRRAGNFDPATLDDGCEHEEVLQMDIPFGFTRNPALGLPVGKMSETIRVCLDLATAEEVGVKGGVLKARLHCTFAHLGDKTGDAPAARLMPTVQTHTQHLVTGPREGSLTSHVHKLPFRGPVKNLLWSLKETVAAPPGTTFHARYVGDPGGTCLAFQASPYDSSGYGLSETISEKLAPLYDAALSYNNQATIVHRHGSYFNRSSAGDAAGRCMLPGSYFYSLALHPSDLNPEGYVDLTDDLQLWLHFRTRACTSAPLSRITTDREARNIGGLRQLKVYAEGFELVTFEGGKLVMPWTYSTAFDSPDPLDH